MSHITCPYRIYPAWFNGTTFGPMNELAQGAANRMGRIVIDIETEGHGEDHRGPYVNFRVTYSSTSQLRATS